MFDKTQSLPRNSPPSSLKGKSQWSLSKGLGFRKSSSSSSDSQSIRLMARTPSPTSDSCKFDVSTPRLRVKPQLAHTPPSAPSSVLHSAQSTLLSLDSPVDSSDCCFCDIPLHFVLESEEIAKLSCSHLAHFQCLVQLTKVLNQTRNNVEKLRLPPCGMCDEPSTLSSSEAHQRFVKAILDDVSASIAKQPSLSKLQQTVTPFHQRALQSSTTHSCSHSDCQAVACDLNMFTQVSSVLPKKGPAQIKCLISLSSPTAPFMQPAKCATYKENALMLQEIACLRELSYKGASLGTMNLNRLRFIHKFKFSHDLFTWVTCTVFLFETLLIVTHERANAAEVCAVYDLQENVRGAKVVNRGSLPYLQILTQLPGAKARMFLIDDESEPIFALCAALHDSMIQFPMAPTAEDTHLSTVCEYTGQLASRSPLNFIMCMEMPSTPRQAQALVQTLAAVRDKMSNFDRCGLVLQGPNGVVTCEFQRKSWAGWSMIESKLNQLCPPLDVVDLDKSLEAAEQLLRNFRVERSLAAIVILSSTCTAYISDIATGFVYSDTPIITIGIDNNYDHFALDTIACKTDGYFISCESMQLKQHIRSVFKYAASRTHKNIEVMLQPAQGCAVGAIEGWAAEPISFGGHKVMSVASDIVYRCTQNNGAHTVPLGSLSEQTTKSFIVTVDIADCASLDFDQLLNITVSSRSPLSTLHHRCQFQTTLAAPHIPLDNIDLFRRQIHIETCVSVKQICNLFESGQHKLAFKQSIAAQSQCLDSRYSAADPNALKQMQDVLTYIEQFFEEFSDKLFQASSHSALLSDLVAFKWYAGVSIAELLHKQTKL